MPEPVNGVVDLLENETPWRLRWWCDMYAEVVTDQAAELARQYAILTAPSSPINQAGYSESDDVNGEGVLIPAGLYSEMYLAWLAAQS